MENRPTYLKENLRYYKEFPRGYHMDVDYSHLPLLLNFDFHTLNGILPVTTSRYKFIGENGEIDGKKTTIIFANPLPEEYEYFESIGVTEFQAISIVINFYVIEKVNQQVLRGLPYAVSLLPMTKNNKIDTWNIELLKKFDLREICQQGGHVYTEFNPFKEWYKGYSTDYSLFSNVSKDDYVDSIGFEWGMYFLAPIYHKNEVVIPENKSFSKAINAKYKKYKINRYFKPFSDTKPRQIWGCGSPIELFLLQGLYTKNIVPEIQMGFYRNGDIFPNYYRMAENEVFVPEDRLITTADFYYPNQRIAVFCDGKEFHDPEKDKKINEHLNAIGIKVLRFTGKEITEELERVLNEIESSL